MLHNIQIYKYTNKYTNKYNINIQIYKYANKYIEIEHIAMGDGKRMQKNNVTQITLSRLFANFEF